MADFVERQGLGRISPSSGKPLHCTEEEANEFANTLDRFFPNLTGPANEASSRA